MNVEIGAEAALFPEKEYILYLVFSLQCRLAGGYGNSVPSPNKLFKISSTAEMEQTFPLMIMETFTECKKLQFLLILFPRRKQLQGGGENSRDQGKGESTQKASKIIIIWL
jgi:hypothetical protein